MRRAESPTHMHIIADSHNSFMYSKDQVAGAAACSVAVVLRPRCDAKRCRVTHTRQTALRANRVAEPDCRLRAPRHFCADPFPRDAIAISLADFLIPPSELSRHCPASSCCRDGRLRHRGQKVHGGKAVPPAHVPFARNYLSSRWRKSVTVIRQLSHRNSSGHVLNQARSFVMKLARNRDPSQRLGG